MLIALRDGGVTACVYVCAKGGPPPTFDSVLYGVRIV